MLNCLVVSPLVALMDDQLAFFARKGLTAARLSGDTEDDAAREGDISYSS